MPDTKVESSDDAYFVDFGAEKKKCESKISSAQFWGEKVMLSWAQLEYNHGLAMKKWAETQKCHLRFSEDGCPEVLRDLLKTLVQFAERKAAILMRFSHQIEEYRGIRNILVSFETRDYKPAIERLSKDMRSLVTSHKIREAQAKREKMKHRDSMKKFPDKDKSLAEGHHEGDETDISIGRVAECQNQSVASVDRYNSTMRIEKSQRREFIKYASQLHVDWAKKQKERLCLLLTCIQSFAKKIKTSDIERTKETPLKKIKELIKNTNVNAIVKELEGQYIKIHVCPEEANDKDDLVDVEGIPRASSFSRTPQDPVGYIPPNKTVTLPNVSESYRRSESLPRPAVFRKLDNSCKLMPPSFQFRPHLPDKTSETHSYANCEGNKKLLSTTSKQRQLLTPTTVDITALRQQPSDLCHLTPMECALLIGDGRIVLHDEMVEKRLKATLTPKDLTHGPGPGSPLDKSNALYQDSRAVGNQTKKSMLKAIAIQDGMKSPTARPSTPVSTEASRKHRKGCLTKARTLGKLTPCTLTPSSAPTTPSPVKCLGREGSPLRAGQACKVFLKVIATSRKNSVDEIVKKHYGRHRKLTPSPQSELQSRTLVLVRKSSNDRE